VRSARGRLHLRQRTPYTLTASEQDILCHFYHDFGEILRDLNKQIRGLIFDLDGTLIEAYEAIYLGLAEAFRSFERPIFPPTDLKRNLKADLEATFAPFFSSEEVSRAIPIFRKKYEEVYLEKTRFSMAQKGSWNHLSIKGSPWRLPQINWAAFPGPL